MAAALTHDILIEKRRRLAQLERRAARSGYATPPEIANEIDDLRRELATPPAPASVAESHGILYDLLMETRADVRRLYWLMPLLLLLGLILVKLW